MLFIADSAPDFLDQVMVWVSEDCVWGTLCFLSNLGIQVPTVMEASTADGAVVQLRNYTGDDNQLVQFVPQTRLATDKVDYYEVRFKHSGKALEVALSKTADYSPVDQYTFYGSDNQLFSLDLNPVSAWGSLQLPNSGSQVVDVLGSSQADGAIVDAYSYNGGANQLVRFVSQQFDLDTGLLYGNLQFQHSGKVLDVLEASTADGATVNQWTPNGGDNQLVGLISSTTWTGDSLVYGVSFQFKHSGLYLGVAGSGSGPFVNGTPLVQSSTMFSFQWGVPAQT